MKETSVREKVVSYERRKKSKNLYRAGNPAFAMHSGEYSNKCMFTDCNRKSEK